MGISKIKNQKTNFKNNLTFHKKNDSISAIKKRALKLFTLRLSFLIKYL